MAMFLFFFSAFEYFKCDENSSYFMMLCCSQTEKYHFGFHFLFWNRPRSRAIPCFLWHERLHIAKRTHTQNALNCANRIQFVRLLLSTVFMKRLLLRHFILFFAFFFLVSVLTLDSLCTRQYPFEGAESKLAKWTSSDLLLSEMSTNCKKKANKYGFTCTNLFMTNVFLYLLQRFFSFFFVSYSFCNVYKYVCVVWNVVFSISTKNICRIFFKIFFSFYFCYVWIVCEYLCIPAIWVYCV